jgi:hypothetical protein
MTSAAQVKDKAKAKAGYYLADGSRVPSVTTILGVIAKPALIKWANNLGLKGIDSTKYVDALAAVGTLAHDMILANLRDTDPAACGKDFDKATIDLAENCFLSFLNWKKPLDIEPILVEEALVSESLRFGGRMDFYGKINGKLTLMDFKTGKGIWPEHFYQLSAYRQLLIENDHAAPEDHLVLNIPRTETESFDQKSRVVLVNEWEIFKASLTIYTLAKENGQ